MSSQADKIRSINDPGWDGVNANVQSLRVNNFDAQKEIDINIIVVLIPRKARRYWSI